MPNLIALEDSDKTKDFSVPHFVVAFLSSMDTSTLKLIKRILDSSGISDEALETELKARL